MTRSQTTPASSQILTMERMLAERDTTIEAQAAEIEQLRKAQGDPLFWYRPRSDGLYEGPIHNAQIEKVRKESGGWKPLYTHPVAEQVEQLKAEIERLRLYENSTLGTIANLNQQVERQAALLKLVKHLCECGFSGAAVNEIEEYEREQT